MEGVLPDGELGFAGGHGGEDGAAGFLGVVDVDQGEAAGVFGLGAAQQSPHGGAGDVGQVLLGAGGDGAAAEEDEAGVVQAFVGEPLLDEHEGALGRGADG